MVRSYSFSIFASVVLTFLTADAAIICPPDEAIAPCSCKPSFDDPNKLDFICYSVTLTDERLSEISDAFLNTPYVSPMVAFLVISTQGGVTRVPDQIKLFPELRAIDLYDIQLTSIRKGDFNLEGSKTEFLASLVLSSNQISTIAPGAFKVKIGVDSAGQGTQISLDRNNLTRLESTVFQSLLEQMESFAPSASNGPFLQLFNNPLDCSDCHLTWLIRDNPNLLDRIPSEQFQFVTCANGTKIGELRPSGYADCPAFVCPLGYDGYYANPKNCFKYYSCFQDGSTIIDCPDGLAFNADTEKCDAESVLSCKSEFVCPSANGQFANPLSCSSYYLCIDSEPYLENCPAGFVFNPAISQCDKPQNVPSCQ